MRWSIKLIVADEHGDPVVDIELDNVNPMEISADPSLKGSGLKPILDYIAEHGGVIA